MHAQGVGENPEEYRIKKKTTCRLLEETKYIVEKEKLNVQQWETK